MAVNEELFEGQRQSIEVDQSLPSNPLPRLTAQERLVVAAINAGASNTEAARRSGLTAHRVAKLLEREDIAQALSHYSAEFQRDILPNVVFTRDDAHHMYMTAYRNSANATEQVKATDALVKLHGLTKENDKPQEREINSHKQLEDMPVQRLLELAGYKLAGLNPENVEEGEIVNDA